MSLAVAVVVPAHDEEDDVAPALQAVLASLARARAAGLVAAATVELVAHRCRDSTAAVAGAVLHGTHGAWVHRDDTSGSVGEVRDRGVRRALARLATPAARTWVLSTDADSLVGPGWVCDVLTAARAHAAVGVVGLTTLDRWRGSEPAAAAYSALLAAKMHAGGDLLHQHDHVYGANLAVRADAYLDVGGFPHAVHGEDQALVDALAAGGHRVLRTRAVHVVTSGRTAGRASGGLADRLASLERALSAGGAPPAGRTPASGCPRTAP